MKQTAVYALTEQGARIGSLVAEQLGGDLFLPRGLADRFGAEPFDRIMDLVADTFHRYPRHVFVAAVAIAVRAIAPHLQSKTGDPGVVALDQKGRHVVSVLSGHLGGANRMAREVAAVVGGAPVITTATDTEGVISIDLLAQEKGLAIENPSAIKAVNSSFLSREPVQIFDPDDRLGLKREGCGEIQFLPVNSQEEWARSIPGVWVTWKLWEPLPNQLVLHPPVLVAGVGCNRGTEAGEILGLLQETLSSHSLCPKSLRCIASIEEKLDEKGLLESARELNVPLFFFKAEELKAVKVPNPSAAVKKHMGVFSVCEAAALLKAAATELLVPKTKSRSATLAIALHG